jgi:hypothetical protein
MTKKLRGQRIDTVFVLIIFCVFAVSVLMVLMLSASIYQNITEMTQTGQDERIVLSYIWTKVKGNDDAAKVSVGEFHGRSALYFDEVFDSTTFRTMIYYHDGWVYELFSDTSLDFYPEDGERIIRVESLSFEQLDYGIIRISSGSRSLLVTMRSGATGYLPNDFSDGGLW